MKMSKKKKAFIIILVFLFLLILTINYFSNKSETNKRIYNTFPECRENSSEFCYRIIQAERIKIEYLEPKPPLMIKIFFIAVLSLILSIPIFYFYKYLILENPFWK
ncbi:MAG: hypothetical protein NT076_01305 [Candidatus Pacearchaeota archaeon]|nr:hypothetical protein [Candidatus Pacearchaeota archaeon]